MTAKSDTKQPFFQSRSHLFNNVAILITGLLIFIFVPLFILTPLQTQEFINNGRETQVLGDALLLVLCFYAVVGGYYWLMSLIKLKDIAATHVMLALSWVSLAGFLFPLTKARAMLELRLAPTHVPNLMIVMILSIILVALLVSRYAKTVQVFLMVFLTLAIVPTLPRAFSLFEKQDINDVMVNFSPDKNLVLVGFDGIPGHVMQGILSAKPELAQPFKDFTFYENVVASSPVTESSLEGIVYGNHDFTSRENPSWGDAKDLYFNQADKVNFTSGSYYSYYNENGTKLAAGKYGKEEQRVQLLELYRFVAVRLLSTPGLRINDWVDHTLSWDRKGKFYTRVDGYDRFVDSIQIDSDKPAVIYMHFDFTHWPLNIDEICENRRTDEAWFNKHQNIYGLQQGAICTLKKYAELVDKLKRLGVYDQTMIVLLSDHGMLWRYYNEPPYNLTVNNGFALGFDTYQPFLMIKPVNAVADAISMSDKYVVLDDLAQTNCNLFETAEFCERSPGLDVLNDADIAPDDFFIHVVKDENSGTLVVDHSAVKLPRNVPLEQAMRESDDIILSEFVPPSE